MDKVLKILVGVPAAGKSTFINQNLSDAVVMSTDNILDEYALEAGITYNESFLKNMKRAEKEMWNRLDRHVDASTPVIVIDRTNLTIKSRARFIERVKGLGYKVEAIVFPVPDKKEWERRLNSRPGKNIPENVLKQMLTSFQMPLMDEGIDEITFVGGVV